MLTSNSAITLALASLALTANAVSPVGPAYEALTAINKLDLIWSLIKKDSTPAKWGNPLITGVQLLRADMKPTMEFVGDELPKGRSKLIHQTAVVAPVEWIPAADVKYTGLFKGGKGLIRWGTAKEPNKNDAGATYGFGFKLLRDGVPSGSYVAMYSLNDWDTWNPFYYPYSNIVPDPEGFTLATLKNKFEEGSPKKWALGVGLSDFAAYDSAGKKAAKPIFPFRIAMVPNRDLRQKTPKTYVADSNTVIKKSVPAGTMLFDVFAYDAPGSPAVYIGSVKTLDAFTTTAYEQLFFRHTRLDDDAKLRPELESYYVKNEGSKLPPLPGVDTFPKVKA